MIDIATLKMQYEILNKPIEEIARESGLQTRSIQQEAERDKWVQWFPEPDLTVDPSKKHDTEAMQEISEDFTARTKHRLAIYNIAKDLLLAQRYFMLEMKIIDKANNILEIQEDSLSPSEIKTLSSLYSEMSKQTITRVMQSVSLTQDDNGIPTVIVKNLSNK